jgi:hypothetical protein
MSKMSLHDPFGHLTHKLWPKEGSGITPISLHASGVLHNVENILMKATTLLQTSSQLEVYT